MVGDNHWRTRPRPRRVSSLSFPFLFLSLLFLLLLLLSDFTSAKGDESGNKQPSLSPSPSPAPNNNSRYSPPDNYLIDCGSPQKTELDDGRSFRSDADSRSFLSTSEDMQTTDESIPANASGALPLYRTAKIFPGDSTSTYTFYISKPGKHWVRLYFHPVPHKIYNLTSAVFTVQTEKFVLLHDFSVRNDSSFVFKEFLVNSSDRFSLNFKPNKGSFAFINAIEVVSVPDQLIPDSAIAIPGGNTVNGLSTFAVEVCYRLNVGGSQITPRNDTLSRTWLPDTDYNVFPQGTAKATARGPIKYPETGATPLIAPDEVYATAAKMAEAQTMTPNFNLTWSMRVDASFTYFVRLHFCDILSESVDDMDFTVYINGVTAISTLVLSQKVGINTAYYADFVIHPTSIRNGSVVVQVCPAAGYAGGTPQAILNGLELSKLSNDADSLDGLFGVDGTYKGPGSAKMKIIAGFGLLMGATAMAFLVVMCCRWKKRPDDWERRSSFSSWLLPLHGSHTSLSSKSSSRKSSFFSFRKSKSSGFSSTLSNQGLGRFFSFNELQAATQNFDEKAVIGVGGFGKVYLGVMEDGTKLAIKRGNPGSEQGINEFQTEIQMLSKLRHRHLVSLIGFCDEQSEMILIYEYMANGPFRDHIYGSNMATLSWKQRLEICIGAARGLHYLHTGAAQGIIHRDVKTTNILLDENFVAKVSDFGLSKAAALDQGHVSTAVKGSFGYLDPEYFRRQQLTEKSDVYSFGVVLFEVLCARPVICPQLPREQVSLAEWAMKWHRTGMIEKIVDPTIAGTITEGSLKKYVEAAVKCLAEHGVDRPGMGDVLWNLEYALQLQEASAEVDRPEDKSANLIALEKSADQNCEAGSGGSTAIDISDNSEVAADALFSQIANFQGR